MKKSNLLNDIIDVAIRIDNRQYERYVDKKTKIKTHSIKWYFKKDSMKLNITKIKKLRTKICYFYKKKNYLKRNYSQNVIKVTKKWIEMMKEKRSLITNFIKNFYK